MTHPTKGSGIGNGSLALRRTRELPPPSPITAGLARTVVHRDLSGRTRRSAAIAAVLVLAAVLRVYGLVRQSAWADEITTLFIADPSHAFGRFWELVLSDTHPPLYYLLMRWWFAVFGQSDLAARLPSIIFGISTVGAAAIVFKPCRFRVRLALMLFLAVSPGAIEYAQEARSYSLLLFLATIVTGLCFRIIQQRNDSDRDLLRSIMLLTSVGTIAAYTHYFGFLIALAAVLVAMVSVLGRRRPFIAAATGLAILVAAVVPWIFYHAHYMSYGLRMSGWIAGFSASAMVSWFIALWLGGNLALIGLAVGAGTHLSLPRFRALARNEATYRIALVLPLLTLGMALAVSCYAPVITSRNLIVVLPALYLGMAALVDDGATRWGLPLASAALTVQLLLMMQPLPSYYDVRTKEQWRESAAFVLAQPRCQTGPIYVYGEALNYRYLVDKARPNLRLVEVPAEGGAPPPLPMASDCDVLLWAADLPRAQFDAALSTLPIKHCSLHVATFYWAFVAMRERSGTVEKAECEASPLGGDREARTAPQVVR